MKDMWRRLRGALGIGLTWAAGWAPLGAVLGWVVWILLDPPVGLGAIVATNAATFGFLGFLGGALFSGVLRLAEGRRRFDQLSLPRFTAWGAVGGLLLGGMAVVGSLWGAGGTPLLSGVIVTASAVLGAGSAAGSLALARRAEGRDVLEAEVADAGLTEAEAERLAGRTRGQRPPSRDGLPGDGGSRSADEGPTVARSLRGARLGILSQPLRSGRSGEDGRHRRRHRVQGVGVRRKPRSARGRGGTEVTMSSASG